MAFDDKPRFELQRSDDGINFKKQGVSTSKSSNKTDAKINYDYTDHNAKGINYYRLQQADKNGILTYSNTLALEAVANIHIANIYPNPAKDVVNIEIGNINATKMQMVVTDAYGKIVVNNAVELINKGTNHVRLAISNLPNGAYTIKLINKGYENAAMSL